MKRGHVFAEADYWTNARVQNPLFDQIIRNLELLRTQCLQAESNLEETSSLLNKLGAKWAAPISEEMGKMREHPAIVEEKARLEWIPQIKEKCGVHGNVR